MEFCIGPWKTTIRSTACTRRGADMEEKMHLVLLEQLTVKLELPIYEIEY